MKKIYYTGNGAYCYANSASMLLASIKEEIQPSLIEVLTGTSIGLAIVLDKETKQLSFDTAPNLLPDLGITKALDILGFTYQTKFFDKPEDFPTKELKNDLKLSPAIIGPVDMGYLAYDPDSKYLKGFDHFVLAYKIEGDILYLHDPEKLPHVFLPLALLKKAWQANGIKYKKGYYRYTFAPKRTERPGEEEIYSRAIKFFKSIYKDGEEKTDKNKELIGSDALREYAKHIRENGLEESQRGLFIYFALPLGAKRALDYSKFFEPYDKKISDLKYQQSEIFGNAHVFAVNKDCPSLAKAFFELAQAEELFRAALMNL